MKRGNKKIIEAVKTIEKYCDSKIGCCICPLLNVDNGSCLIADCLNNIELIEKKLEAENECCL